MGKRQKIYVALLAGIMVLSQLSAQQAETASAQSSANTKNNAGSLPGSLGMVSLGSNVNVSLENANIWQQPGGNILSYTLNYSNGSGRNASLRNYFSKVITPGGSVLQGRPIHEEDLKKNVIAKGSTRVTYYVNIGQMNSLKGIKIGMFIWDANAKGYLRQTGVFPFPANYSPAAASGKSMNTFIQDIPITGRGQSLEIYKYNGKVYAKVGFMLINRGNKVLEDSGTTAYLVSAGGSRYELALSSAQVGYKIQPQEKKTIYYVTEIPPYLKTDNMKLQFTRKDETLKLEYATSSYALPAAVQPNLVVGPGQIKNIDINSNSVETKLQNASVYAENDLGQWSFQLHLKNKGDKPVTMPTYELSVRSSDGKSFPVEAGRLNGLTLKPLEEKVIPLHAEIPLEVEQNSLKLEMIESVAKSGGKAGSEDQAGSMETAGENNRSGTNGSGGSSSGMKLNTPVAYFTIPYMLHTDTQKEVVYNTTNQYGTFSYSLDSLQRFPWKDEDIVIAKLNITNTQSKNISLPELKGAFKLDNDDLTSSTELFTDSNVTTLAPGKSVELNVLAKVPYTTDFNSIKIELYSSDKDVKVPFLTLSTRGTMNAVTAIDKGGSYTISTIGKKAKVQENKTTVYEGSNYNIVYSEMLLSNEEKRQSQMQRLQAYFRTSDGQLYHAVSNQTDAIATPGFKQLVVFWTKLPKSVSTSDLQMYLGEGITDNKYSGPGDDPTGFVNVSSLELSPVRNSPQSNFTNVPLLPYTLSVLNSTGSKMKGSDTMNITINYDLQRDNRYEIGNMDHKLILRMTDPYGQSQEKTLSIGTDLIEGNNTYSASYTNNLYKDMSSGGYKLTLYEEMIGERIELASQSYYLSVTNGSDTQQ
ncbi:hypothetical protein GRF59_02905 [Paenibacillus sp. HJL G12]|uniref:Uncharacterized protein n=1 Tax=Paenibacillus dendrobii TaxID=2691084 RepID=A0A7X3IFJ3_9BACL|nr:hypothetical protein [Paenibacillus dendrobii]MWV42566.1 hypothetical protein [Paenibacillus dendrobii]